MADETIPENRPAVITRQEAKARGLKFYFPGSPCHKGHLSQRYVANFDCVQCRQEAKKPKVPVDMSCSVEGCSRKRDAKGFCPKHYNRWKTYGDPLYQTKWNGGDRVKWIENHKDYDGDECLIWPFGRKKKYPLVYWNGENVGVHVVMCGLRNGPRPRPDLEAAHSCGMGHEGCVSPKHLRWATRQENAEDKRGHGTMRFGNLLPMSKLTHDEVRQIKALSGVRGAGSVAKSFDVSKSTIQRIWNGRLWWYISE